MRIQTLICFFTIATLTGCASTKQVESTNEEVRALNGTVTALSTQVAMLQQKANRPMPRAERVCYLAGQPYSPGSVVAGRICDDLRGLRISDQPPEWGWRLNTNNR